jgi:DNA-binding FadR family transcriptional regulator
MTALHTRVLDELGAEICSGRRDAASTLTLDDVERLFSVSRSVARETVRVLEALGLVVSRQRVGIIVQPEAVWNTFDARVIRWRMSSPERDAEIRALAELRLAVEPEAARLAAERAQPSDAAALVGVAAEMWAAYEQGDAERFHTLDLAFHARLLSISGNHLFARLDSVVGETLAGRHSHELDPAQPTQTSAQLHAAVAAAIQRHRPDDAAAAMRRLLQLSDQETVSAP